VASGRRYGTIIRKNIIAWSSWLRFVAVRHVRADEVTEPAVEDRGLARVERDHVLAAHRPVAA
jgi:hypothetical protein